LSFLKSKPIILKEINISQKKIMNKLLIKCKFGCRVSFLDYFNHLSICLKEKNRDVVCWNWGKSAKESDMKLLEMEKDELLSVKVK